MVYRQEFQQRMRLVILGAGGYGRTVADIARQLGYDILFLDDNSSLAAGKCADFAQYRGEDTLFYAAFGNNESRLGWLAAFREHGCAVATLVHPTAYVSPTAALAAGTAVLPYAIVNTECVIEEGCIINCGAIVDHGCIVEAGCHISPGAIVKAENRIPRLTKVESGQVIQNRVYPL